MITTGLVLTLAEDAAVVAEALNILRGRVELTVGERLGRKLPVAVEALDSEQTVALHSWLLELDGVKNVDVVSVHFEDDSDVKAVVKERETGEGQSKETIA